MSQGTQWIKIARHEGGSATVAEIDRAIADAWAEVLADPSASGRAAILLGTSVDKLPKSAPFRTKAEGSGLTGVESIVLMLALDFAKDLGWDMAKDAAKEEIKRGVNALWKGLLKTRTEGRLESDAIGREVPLPDDVQ